MAIGSVVIDLLMRTGSFVTDTDKAARGLRNIKKEAQDTGSTLNKVKGQVVAFGATLAASLSVSAAIKYADAWSDMKSVVGAAIGDMSKSGEMMTRIVDIANASYSSLEQTAASYSRNVSVLRELGKSSAEAADFTESLNHMLVLTATRGERAASVQNALSKAMAVGKLQADGLETVLANGGEVTQALANELGTTVNGLRGLASEGKITGEVIANAIIKPLDDVRERAGEMPATVGDAFTRVQTNVTELIGVLDGATGASSALADGIISIADGIRDFTSNIDVYIGDVINSFDELIFVAREFETWVDGIASMFGLAMGDMASETDSFSSTWSGATVGWGDSISRFIAQSLLEAQDLLNFFAGVAEAISAAFSQLATNIVAFFSNAWLSVKKGAADALNVIIDAMNSVSSLIGADPIKRIEVTGGGGDAVAKSISQAISEGFAQGKKHFDFGDRAMARYADYAMGSQATKIYKENFGAGDTVETLPAIRASSPPGGGGGGQRGRSGGGGRRSAADNEKKAWEETHKAIERAQLAAKEYLSKLDEGYARTLGAFGLGKREQEIAEGLNKITSEYQQNVMRLNESYAGKTRDDGYYKQVEILQETYDTALEKAKSFYEQETALRGNWQLGFSAAMKDYADEAMNVYDSIGNVAGNAIRGMEDALVDFVTTGKASFKDLAESIIKDLARIAIQQNITGPLANALGGLFGGHSFGGAGTVASVGHGFPMGGLYSSGGYTGAGGKYEPAGIVHKGEVVFSQDDVRRLGGVGRVEALRLRGYSSGGVVGGSPSLGGGVQVNITNNSSQPVSASANSRFDGKQMVIDVVLDDLSRNGQIAQTMKQMQVA